MTVGNVEPQIAQRRHLRLTRADEWFGLHSEIM
jgi:hypothetical protein